MTKEEKEKAIDALKISAPVMAMTQEEFNDYIQTLNKVMDWLEQEPITDRIEYGTDGNAYRLTISNGKEFKQEQKILETLDFAIDASNGDTNYFVGFRNGLRYAKSLIDGEEEPQFESCAEKEPILDKIRDEIMNCLKALDEIEKSGFNIYLPNEMSGRRLTYQQCLEFIDKYKVESEEKENG